MAKNLDIILLFDFYGEMLTQKQQDFICYYYDEDLSLAEIAENEGITRQGVRDGIKRAEFQLYSYEKHLGLCERFNKIKESVKEIDELTEIISEINRHAMGSKEVSEAIEKINAITKTIAEQ